jgi:predicted dehydrogenase
MPMEKIKVGVIGLGWIAQVVHLPILRKLPEAEIIAVCDKLKDRARLVGEKYGIRRVTSNPVDLLANEEIQALVICTPTDTHKEIALAALQAGKHVLVEKPIAPTYHDALEIAEAARRSSCKLIVGMNHRFRPDAMILKTFIEGGELGDIFYIRTGWLRKRSTDARWLTQKEKSGGGVLVDLGIVILDMAFWMMGFPRAQRVNATHYFHTTREVEDTSLLSVKMENGSHVSIDVSWSMCLQDDVYYCQIFGTEGTASLNPLRINKQLHGNLVNVAPSKLDPPEKLFKRSYENELRHFLAAVRGLHPPISSADEATQRMRIIEAAYRSSRLGKEVAISSQEGLYEKQGVIHRR